MVKIIICAVMVYAPVAIVSIRTFERRLPNFFDRFN